MKKLIFGLTVFATSVFGIIVSVGLNLLGDYIYISRGGISLSYTMGGIYLRSTTEMIGGFTFAFVITAVIGFVIALVGAFTKEKQKSKVKNNEKA